MAMQSFLSRVAGQGIRCAFVVGCIAVSAAQASPFLRCEVTYAGATQVVHATPVADPYEVAPVDIAERFLFKVVMTATRGRLDPCVDIYLLATRAAPCSAATSQIFCALQTPSPAGAAHR